MLVKTNITLSYDIAMCKQYKNKRPKNMNEKHDDTSFPSIIARHICKVLFLRKFPQHNLPYQDRKNLFPSRPDVTVYQNKGPCPTCDPSPLYLTLPSALLSVCQPGVTPLLPWASSRRCS